MSRKSARNACLQLIYEAMMGGDGGNDTLIGLCGFTADNDSDLEYITTVTDGIKTHRNEIDAIIASHLKGWTLDRISRISYAALQIAVFEIKWMPDIPPSVSIQEAVELTQRFDEHAEGLFVNGVLRNVLNDEQHQDQ